MFRIFDQLGSIRRHQAGVPTMRRPRFRPRVEALEDRCVPAGIALVHDLGTAATFGTTARLALAAPVAAGDSILVEVATLQANVTGAVSVSDGAGNAYTKDADLARGSAGAGWLRVLVFAAHHVRALPAGAALTVTLADGLRIVASAAEFAGLGHAAPVDVTAGGSGVGNSPSSGLAATPHADDLLLGAVAATAFALLPPNPVAFTPGAAYAALASATATGGFDRIDLLPEYRIVSAAGSYAADGTLGDSRTWAAALVAYRAADGPSADLPPGLTDVTAAVTVTPRRPVALANGRTRLRLTLQNGGDTIAGPLTLVLTNLPRRARLRNRGGFTALVPPAGRPFLTVLAGADGLFTPGETLSVVLDFAGRLPRRFRPAFRIVAGLGPR